MKVAIGCDHAGTELKRFILDRLKSQGVTTEDFGTNSTESVDYPDYAHLVSHHVESGKSNWGILICGSANGMAMAANKHAGIRCALCWRPDVAALAKEHNNANIIALPARFVTPEEGWSIVDAFLKATFEGGRHERRVNKISC